MTGVNEAFPNVYHVFYLKILLVRDRIHVKAVAAPRFVLHNS